MGRNVRRGYRSCIGGERFARHSARDSASCRIIAAFLAGMAELADAADSKWVRTRMPNADSASHNLPEWRFWPLTCYLPSPDTDAFCRKSTNQLTPVLTPRNRGSGGQSLRRDARSPVGIINSSIADAALGWSSRVRKGRDHRRIGNVIKDCCSYARTWL